jgi:hypothetical protein
MRNEDIEGRLQNIEVSMNAILLRLKWIEDELHPKKETAHIPPTPVAPTVTPIVPDPAVHSGPPPIIATPSSEEIVAHERELLKPKIPEYMRENLEAAQASLVTPPPAAASAVPPAPPTSAAAKSQFTLPTPPTADDIEYKFGINGLLRGGAVVIVIAILFGVAIMISRGKLTPPVQFASEIMTCLAFIGIGFKKRDEREDFGQLMVGIGSFGLYASFAAGYAYKHLYEGEPLVAMYLLLSMANLGFAFWRSSKSFLTIGMLGGLVAAMMPMHKDRAMLDFALHFLILTPCAAIIVRNKWNGMAGLMWVVSTAALIPATTSDFDQFWRVGATYMNCAIALYACGKVFKPSDFDKHAAIQTIMLVLTGFFAIAIDTGHKGSLHAIVLAAIAAGIGYAIQENEKARNATWLGGLIVFAVITPIGFTQNVAAFAYGIEALALILVAIRYQLIAVWAVSLSTFIFSLVAYLYFPDKNEVILAHFSPPLEMLLLAVLAATTALNIRYALPHKMKEVQDWAMLVSGALLVAFFVRGMNVVIGDGHTLLRFPQVNTLALGIAGAVVLAVANRYQRLAVWIVGLSSVGVSLAWYLAETVQGMSFVQMPAVLELIHLATLAGAVGLGIRFLMQRQNTDAQEAALLFGGASLVGGFVRTANILLSSTALTSAQITLLSAATAGAIVLGIANRFPRLAFYFLGSITAFASLAFYFASSGSSDLTFVKLAPVLEYYLLIVYAAAVCLNVRFVLRRDDKNAQELCLFIGGSLLVALFIRAINIALGNGNTSLHVEDVNSLGLGLAGLGAMLIGVVSKRKGLLVLSTILTAWIGILALALEPELAPYWMSPILILLAASCVVIGSKYITDSQDESYQEPLMVFAGLAMSAFFVRLMHLVGINHVLELTKETATYFSLGLLNAIWIGFLVRNRRPANLILGWMSFVVAAFSGASPLPNNSPSWLSPILLLIPTVALGFLYVLRPRQESNEGSFTALCIIPGWFLSTLFLRQESMRPWIGLNNVASYTAAWVIFAVFLIVVGFKLNRRFLRYWALAVFATTVTKVFLVDLSELDSIIRVAMLTLLGLGMMGGGYWYILWRRAHTAKAHEEVLHP